MPFTLRQLKAPISKIGDTYSGPSLRYALNDIVERIADSTVGTSLIAGSGAVGASADESFLVAIPSADLTGERVLTGTANRITLTDGGANSTLTISAPQDLHTATAFQVLSLAIWDAPAAKKTTLSRVAAGSDWTLTLPNATPTTNGTLALFSTASAMSFLSADTSDTRKFLRTLSLSGVGQPPVWDTLLAADIPSLSGTYVTIATIQTITAEKTIRNLTADTAPLTVNALAGHTGNLQSWQVNGTPVLYVNKDGTIYTASTYMTWVGQQTTLVVGAAAGPRDVTIPAMNGDAVIPIVGFGTDPAGSGEVAVVNRVGASAIASSIGPIKLTNAVAAGFYLISATLETQTTSGANPCTMTVKISWQGVTGYTIYPFVGPLNLQLQNPQSASFPVYLASGDITWSTVVVGTIGTGKAALRIRCHFLGP